MDINEQTAAVQLKFTFRFIFKNLFQDSASCGGHSSGGSTSSLSTPPSVSQSPPQAQLNGIATVGAAPAGLGGVAGLMGALGAGNALGILNGVIQTPGGTTSPHTHTTAAATGVTLPVNRYVLTVLVGIKWFGFLLLMRF